MQNKKINLYYAFNFAFSLLFWYPVFYEFQKKSGLSPEQIFKLQSLYYIAHLIVELPSGWIADRYGNVNAMRIGGIGLVAANLTLLASTGYDAFFLHFTLMAFCRSMVTGAADAYVFNILKKDNQTDRFKNIEGRGRALSLFGKVACWSVVGLLMQIRTDMPYVLTAIAGVFAALFAFGMKSADGAESRSSKIKFNEWGSALYRSVTNSRLVLMMLQGVSLYVIAHVCQINFFGPTMNAKGFDIKLHGIIMSLMTLFEAAGSLLVTKIKKADRMKILATVGAMSLAMLMIGYGSQIITVLGFCGFGLAAGVAIPLQAQMMNETINEKGIRATVLSVESIVDRAVVATVTASLAYFTKNGLVREFFSMASILSLALLILVFVLQNLFVKREGKEIG